MKYKCFFDGLDCAHCAKELEEEISKIEGINNVTVTYPDCICSFECEDNIHDEIEEKIIEIVKNNEPDVVVKKDHEHHHHHHDDSCECHHDHHHHHHDEDECSCGCHHHEEVEEKELIITELTRKYRIEGLDCENCAKRLERKIAEIDGISNVNVSYIRSSISFDCEDRDLERIKKEVVEVAKREEEEATIYFDDDEKVIEKETDNDKVIIIRLIIGAILFVISLFLQGNIKTIVSLLSYLILGYDVLLKAIRNIGKGQIFDENFLMAVATIAAIYLKDYVEASAVMLFYQIGEFFQDLAVKHSRKSIGELMDIRPDYANVLHDDHIHTVNPSEVNVGDIVVVKPGERVPLDGVIIEGSSSLNTSSLTGESALRDVDVDDEVLNGTVNETGVIKLRVTKRYNDSSVQKILNLIEDAENKKASHEKFITKFAKYYTPIVVALAIITAIFTAIINKDINEGIYRACTFLVISCPCALVISVPLSFFAGIGGLSKKGILVKGADVIEKLVDIKQLLLDKTGTVTKGIFIVEKVLDADNEDKVLQLASALESNSNHPIAEAIANRYQNTITNISNIKEIAGRGLKATINNEEVLVGNKKLMDENNIKVSEHGEGTVVYVANNNKYEGCIVLKDEIKPNIKTIIQSINNLGLKSILVSGDSNEIVKEVKEEIGIDEAYGECLPEAKVRVLEKIQENGSVGFVGDGINDAPVLVSSDVGFAMGALGSDAAIEAADIVIMDDNLAKVPMAYKNSKRIIDVAKQNIYGAIIIKVLILILGAFGKANMWMAIFADTGVAMLCVLNSIRLLKIKD